MAPILRNGGSQSPDRWLREHRNNHQILFLYPDRHGRSSYSSGIWIFPRPQTSFWILILNSDLLHEIQFPCCVLTCFLLNPSCFSYSGTSIQTRYAFFPVYLFTMKTWHPEYRVTKLLLDAAHDADAVSRYCQESGI